MITKNSKFKNIRHRYVFYIEAPWVMPKEENTFRTDNLKMCSKPVMEFYICADWNY